VEATEAGESGNVEIGGLTVIEGTLGLSAKVTNLEATVGGTNAKIIGSTEQDRSTLRDRVLAGLNDKAKEQVRASIGAGDLLISDTLKITEVRSEQFSPFAGEPGTQLTFSVQAEFSARYILAQDLKALAASSVTASIPQGFSPQGDMAFNPLAAPITDAAGITRFQLQASQTALQDVDLLQVFNLIRGREQGAAAMAVKDAFSFKTEPQITITPTWWKWLPLMPFNISVEVK